MTREASKELQDGYQQKYPHLNPLFTFAVPGYNMRSTEINAVLGIEQMKRIDYNIERRRHNLALWNSSLNSLKFYTDYNLEGNSSFVLPLVLREQDKEIFKNICNLLENQLVEYRTGTAGGGNQTLQPYMVEGKYDYSVVGDLTYTNHIHHYSLYVGNHPELTDEQILDLCRRLNNV